MMKDIGNYSLAFTSKLLENVKIQENILLLWQPCRTGKTEYIGLVVSEMRQGRTWLQKFLFTFHT